MSSVSSGESTSVCSPPWIEKAGRGEKDTNDQHPRPRYDKKHKVVLLTTGTDGSFWLDWDIGYDLPRDFEIQECVHIAINARPGTETGKLGRRMTSKHGWGVSPTPYLSPCGLEQETGRIQLTYQPDGKISSSVEFLNEIKALPQVKSCFSFHHAGPASCPSHCEAGRRRLPSSGEWQYYPRTGAYIISSTSRSDSWSAMNSRQREDQCLVETRQVRQLPKIEYSYVAAAAVAAVAAKEGQNRAECLTIGHSQVSWSIYSISRRFIFLVNSPQ